MIKKNRKKIKNSIRDRTNYSNMQPDQKKAKIEQVVANKALRRDTLSKDSIAM